MRIKAESECSFFGSRMVGTYLLLMCSVGLEIYI